MIRSCFENYKKISHHINKISKNGLNLINSMYTCIINIMDIIFLINITTSIFFFFALKNSVRCIVALSVYLNIHSTSGIGCPLFAETKIDVSSYKLMKSLNSIIC